MLQLAYWTPKQKQKTGPGYLRVYTDYDRKDCIGFHEWASRAEAKKYCKKEGIQWVA